MRDTLTQQPATDLKGSWGALAILFAISACSMADRFILSILAPAIKKDLVLSDLQVGLLVGPAIGVLYALMCVPFGYLADRINRVRFLSCCLVVWSVFTALGGLAVNGWQLALTRLGVAAAEGGSTPSGVSLIADYFPPQRRALASAVHASATSVGMFLAFAVGGIVAQSFGWRTALVVAGLPGIALAVVSIALLREPVRGQLDRRTLQTPQALSFIASVRHIFSVKIYRRSLLGTMSIYVATSVITAWGPAFLQRKFGASSALIGFNFGLGLAVIGTACVLAAGWYVNRVGLSRFGHSLRVLAALEAFSVVFLLLALLAPNFAVSLVALSVLYGLTNLYLPFQLSVVQNYLPATMRATGSALASLSVVMVVHGLVPPLVGALSDALEPTFGTQSLAMGMLVALPAILLSAVLFLRVATVADATSGSEPAPSYA